MGIIFIPIGKRRVISIARRTGGWTRRSLSYFRITDHLEAYGAHHEGQSGDI
jgi:hypothetical protein